MKDLNANGIDAAISMIKGSALSMGIEVVEQAMAKQGKRLRDLRAKIDPEKAYPLDEAIALVKGTATAKFDESVEVALNLGVDRGTPTRWCAAPPTCRMAPASPCSCGIRPRRQGGGGEGGGADLVGAEDLAQAVQEGEMNFDRCIATPT